MTPPSPTQPPASAEQTGVAVVPEGPAQGLQHVTAPATPSPAATNTAVLLNAGSISLDEAAVAAAEALRALPGVDLVNVTLIGFTPAGEASTGWHRLGERAWLYEWSRPGSGCSALVADADANSAGSGVKVLSLPWLSQHARPHGVAVPDIGALPAGAEEDKEQVRQCGARALVSIPMICDGNMYGALSISRSAPGLWSPEHIASVRLLTASMAGRAAVHRSRAQLADAVARSDQARDSQQQFFAAVGHELRTPLSAILGTAEVLAMESGKLRQTASSDQGAEGLDTFVTTVHEDSQVLISGGEQLHAIVEDLLAHSQSLGSRKQSREQVNVLQAVKDVEHWVRTAALLRNVTLTLSVPADLEVYAGASSVRQVLTNVVGNAIAYTREGGSVHVSAKESIADEYGSARVRINVLDDGPGLTLAQQETVFQPFVRFDNASSSGTGLGLAIARVLVERDGGRIGVVSRPESGADFWIDLPARAATV